MEFITKHCESCGIPFKTIKNRFCSRECWIYSNKGGKTYEEKKKEAISRINENWINKKSQGKRRVDPTSKSFTNY